MALVTTTEMFKKAYDGGYAIGAFNVNNMEIVALSILLHALYIFALITEYCSVTSLPFRNSLIINELSIFIIF